MEKIKITDFIKQFDEADKEKQTEIVIGVIKKKYVPLAVKTAVCQSMVSSNYTLKGEVSSNSVALYLSYIIGMVELYTSLEVPRKDAHLAYDLLQERGIVDILIKNIGSDILEYETIFKMCRDDFESNNMKPYALFQKYSKYLSTLFSGILEEMVDDEVSGAGIDAN